MCVYDLYLTLLETYREELAIMRSTLRAQDVLASTWPEELKVRWVLLLGTSANENRMAETGSQAPSWM